MAAAAPPPSPRSRIRCSSASRRSWSFRPQAYGDLKQSTVAINFQIVWMRPLTDRFDLSVFGGPSIIRVKQDIASATAEDRIPCPTIESQSETTGKAGTVGVDLSYRLNDRYGVGGFVRYAGGAVDLPCRRRT